MASRNISTWIPIPLAGEVEGTVIQESVVGRVGRRRPMTSDSQEFPRLLGSSVNGGTDLTENTYDGSKVTLYSYQFNGKDSLDEDEVEDSAANAFVAYSFEWLNQAMVAFDNSALGVTGARSSTATDKRPYTSVYKAVITNDTDAAYTANTNLVQGAATYAKLSETFSKIESGRFWRDSDIVVIAHPSLRYSLRGLEDDQHRPIFIEAGGVVVQDSLFGKPIEWSLGAKTSSSFDMTEAGNPLLIAVNRQYLVYGPRIEPQSRIIPASMNPSALTHVMQHRMRRGAALTVPQAAAVFEKNA